MAQSTPPPPALRSQVTILSQRVTVIFGIAILVARNVKLPECERIVCEEISKEGLVRARKICCCPSQHRVLECKQFWLVWMQLGGMPDVAERNMHPLQVGHRHSIVKAR